MSPTPDPVPKPTPKPTPKPLKVGDTVKIKKGSKYQGSDKGKPVSKYALNGKWKINKIEGSNARLSTINSWIALKDLERG